MVDAEGYLRGAYRQKTMDVNFCVCPLQINLGNIWSVMTALHQVNSLLRESKAAELVRLVGQSERFQDMLDG
jgi:hypothetical protein